MKKLFLFTSLIISLPFVINAQSDTTTWSSPSEGTLQGIPFVITNLNDSSISSLDFDGVDFSTATLSATQSSVDYYGGSDWTITFNTPINNLRVYARWWRTDDYIFDQPFTILSGSGLTASNDTVKVSGGWGNGIIEFAGPITTLSVTASQGCCSAQSMTIAALSATAGVIENSLNQEFVVYPNPTNGLVTIEFETNQENLTVKLLSLTGQLIETKKIYNSSRIEQEVKQPNGVYLIEISDDNNQRAILRVVKE